MKKIIFVVLIVGLVVGYFALRDESTTKNVTPATNGSAAGQPDPSNATFIFNEGPVTLSAGRDEQTLPGSALVEETILLDKFAYGDLNDDGKEDVVLLLARFGSGSGTFIYLASFVSGPVTYRGSEVTFIGDRISPQTISIDKGVVTVSYLDRKTDEAFAAEPTVPTSKQFVYQDGKFLEK